LDGEFSKVNAKRYTSIVRSISYLSTIFIFVASAIDYADAKANDRLDDTNFRVAIGCKLGIMFPVGMLMVWYTNSPHYIHNSYFMDYVLFLLGVSVCLWGQMRYNTSQVDQDIRAFFYVMFILMTFCFTPCRLRVAAGINGLMVCFFTFFTEHQNGYKTLLLFSYLLVGYTSWAQEILLMNHYLQQELFLLQNELLKFSLNKSAMLLSSMLPEQLMAEMNANGSFRDDGSINQTVSVSKDFADTTVIFCMISRFDELASKLTPELVVTVLNIIYTRFDEMIEHHNVYKVETVGEVYLVAAGLPTTSSMHASEAAEYALAMVQAMPKIRQKVVRALAKVGIDGLGNGIQVQVGLDSGPLVTGVVGTTNVRYKLFGDVVNTASRMESTGEPGCVQVSNGTYSRLERTPALTFRFEKRDPITVKGKGVMQTYFLLAMTRNDGNVRNRMKNVMDKISVVGAYGKTKATEMGQFVNPRQLENLLLVENMLLKRQGDSVPLPMCQQMWMVFGHGINAGGTAEDKFNEAVHVAKQFQVQAGFLEYSYVAYIIAQTLFVLFDKMIYHWDTQFDRTLIAAWGVVIPCALPIMFLDRYFPQFFFRHRVAITILYLVLFGAGTTAQGVVLALPSFSHLAGFIIWQYNVASVPLITNFLISSASTMGYLIIASKTVPGSILVLHAAFLVTFLVGLLPPAYAAGCVGRKITNISFGMDREHRLLSKEEKRGTALLHSLLPKTVVERIQSGKSKLIADSYSNVSVLFTDMKGFTSYSSSVTPSELVAFLNQMYSRFDAIAMAHDIYKVEIIGDAYYAVAGCPGRIANHAEEACITCVKLLRELPAIRKTCGDTIDIRIGIHTGPVVAGVVGLKDPRYHLFGDTVNYANDMESHGVPSRVHISEATYLQVLDSPNLTIEDRGMIEVKGRGERHTYFVDLSPTFDSADYAHKRVARLAQAQASGDCSGANGANGGANDGANDPSNNVVHSRPSSDQVTRLTPSGANRTAPGGKDPETTSNVAFPVGMKSGRRLSCFFDEDEDAVTEIGL
jgi:class 3 adenylate cyclase